MLLERIAPLGVWPGRATGFLLVVSGLGLGLALVAV